jgi:flavin reductase (DIM6/NTAB) family NADH-FMN oxidoreductase RutF
MTLSAEPFKDFFRHHGAGVSLITAFDPEGNPIGFTASSLASLSAAPALATVNLASSSSTAKFLQKGLPVAIHALGFNQSEFATQLAGPKTERFSSEGWDFSRTAPIHQSATAVLLGQVSELYTVAESLIVVIAADSVNLGDFPERPLVYFNRQYL